MFVGGAHQSKILIITKMNFVGGMLTWLVDVSVYVCVGAHGNHKTNPAPPIIGVLAKSAHSYATPAVVEAYNNGHGNAFLSRNSPVAPPVNQKCKFYRKSLHIEYTPPAKVCCLQRNDATACTDPTIVVFVIKRSTKVENVIPFIACSHHQKVKLIWIVGHWHYNPLSRVWEQTVRETAHRHTEHTSQ